ncbi:fimbrial protein [Pseudomonas kulmbachensis]|uniref:fimbrial protein n=1 Tax=Pseudomonas kulmbachensis TaxID=3043408 RepID=UPI002AB1A366|nr:fimbrial protein [Pseudomonas sp. FLM 004-28]
MKFIGVDKRYVTSLAMVWVCVLVSGVARADCTADFDNEFPTFDMGSHYVPRDAPIGSVIGTANKSYTYSFSGSLRCNRGDTLSTLANWPVVPGIKVPALLQDGTVFKTNIPGVGMIVESRWLALKGWEVVSGNYSYSPFTIRMTQLNGVISFPAVVRFTLVKTSHDIPVGTTKLVNGTSAVRFYSGSKILFSTFVTGSVIRSECSLPNTSPGGQTYIDVPMGSVQRREFKGKDSYLDSKAFSIPLTSCVAGTYPTDQSWNFYENSNVNIKFEGAGGSAIIDAARGIVGLTTDSTAKGVAVQIMRKDGVTALKLNEDVPLAQIKGISMSIDLKARYIQTSDSPMGPEPGVANAKAAFSVTYK